MNKPFLCILATLATLFNACSVSDSENEGYSRWAFSGFVVDATSGQGLGGAFITYLDDDGNTETIQTDETGAFHIEDLHYGTRSFTFSYFVINKKDTLQYAPKIINIGSTNESNKMEGIVASAAEIIRLSSLNAGIKGEIYLTDEITGKAVPVNGAKLSIVNQDTSFVNTLPESFETETDSLGRYKFNELPADSGLSLSIAPVNYKGYIYQKTSITLPRLKPNDVSDLSRTVLVRDTLVDADSRIVASNVLDDDLLGLPNVSTLTNPYFVMNEKVNSNTILVRLTCGEDTIQTETKVKNDTIFVNHDTPLPSNSSFTVSIIGYTKKNNERFEITLDEKSQFTTDRGLYVVSTNLSPNCPYYKSTFSYKDTMWIKFSETLVSDVSRVQWSYNGSADASMYANGITANSKAWIKKDTLFAQINEDFGKDLINADTIGLNLTVYAKNGLYATNVKYMTELAKLPESSSSAAESSSSVATSSSSEATMDTTATDTSGTVNFNQDGETHSINVISDNNSSK